MTESGRRIELEVAGLGILLYSPSHAASIAPGSDYLTRHYLTDDQVQPHIQAGTLVGFGTGSPGTFILVFHPGYPTERFLTISDFRLRLGLHVVDGFLCVRDLYDLMEWDPDCPESQLLIVKNGFYHVTLCSNMPPSGVLGDDQLIHVFLNQLAEMPALSKTGIPTLCV